MAKAGLVALLLVALWAVWMWYASGKSSGERRKSNSFEKEENSFKAQVRKGKSWFAGYLTVRIEEMRSAVLFILCAVGVLVVAFSLYYLHLFLAPFFH